MHGWLIEPSDERTVGVFGNRSYNELVELLFLTLGDEALERLTSVSSLPRRTGSLARFGSGSGGQHGTAADEAFAAAADVPSDLPGLACQDGVASTAAAAAAVATPAEGRQLRTGSRIAADEDGPIVMLRRVSTNALPMEPTVDGESQRRPDRGGAASHVESQHACPISPPARAG